MWSRLRQLTNVTSILLKLVNNEIPHNIFFHDIEQFSFQFHLDNFFDNSIVRDEDAFCLNGSVNTHNVREYSPADGTSAIQLW